VDRDGTPILSDGQTVPVDHVVVRGNRFLLDKHGTVWRYKPRGALFVDGDPGQGVLRHNTVEMAKGWVHAVGPDGLPTYKKKLSFRPISPGVNEHPRISTIDWYMQTKGWTHPHSPPHAPTQREIDILDRVRAQTVSAIYAKMGELAKESDLDVDAVREADPAVQAAKLAAAAKPKVAGRPRRKKAAKRKATPRKRRTNRPPDAPELPQTPDAEPTGLPTEEVAVGVNLPAGRHEVTDNVVEDGGHGVNVADSAAAAPAEGTDAP